MAQSISPMTGVLSFSDGARAHTRAHMCMHICVWGALAGVSCCRNSMQIKYGLLLVRSRVSTAESVAHCSLFLERWVLTCQLLKQVWACSPQVVGRGKCSSFQVPQFLLPFSDMGRRPPNWVK